MSEEKKRRAAKSKRNRLPDSTHPTTKTMNYYHGASNNALHTQVNVSLYCVMEHCGKKERDMSRRTILQGAGKKIHESPLKRN